MSKKLPPVTRNNSGPRLNILQRFFLLILIAIALMTTLPLVVVLFIGLLPTLTLMIIDPKNINKLIVVGCFNLAGVFVYIFNVMRNFTVDSALFVFSDIFNLILMLGAAGVGLIVYYELPILFIFLARATNQSHIANIDDRVAKLKEIWGPEVAGK